MIRLLVADDHPVVREGLKRILAECADMAIVDEFEDGHELVRQLSGLRADVLLLDISMPGPGFLPTIRRIRKTHPDWSILVLSVQPEEQYARRALRAGASGYLNKTESPSELAKAIRRVHSGRKYVSDAAAERWADEFQGTADRPLHEALSDREFQVLCSIGSGKSVSVIATDMNLSPKTVSTYRARILSKMTMRTNVELIRYVVENSLLE